MSQITNDIIEGLMCSCCGTCFRDAHGHPVLCNSCWKTTPYYERAGLSRATKKEIRYDGAI